MMRASAILILAAGLTLAACARTIDPLPPPDAPVASGDEAAVPGDKEPVGVRGPVYVDSTELLLAESFPVQARLQVTGTLPTPCHGLKWEVQGPDSNGRIDVALYSLADPALACIQVLEPFETSIPLGTLDSGNYAVYLNGELVGDVQI